MNDDADKHAGDDQNDDHHDHDHDEFLPMMKMMAGDDGDHFNDDVVDGDDSDDADVIENDATK